MGSDFSKLATQFIRYFITGGIAALVEWSIFFILNALLDIHYLPSVLCSFIAATFVNYVISIRYVFTRRKLSNSKEVFLVFFVSFIGLLMNGLFMYIFISRLKVYPLVSKILSTGMVFIWNFVSRKLWIFN